MKLTVTPHKAREEETHMGSQRTGGQVIACDRSRGSLHKPRVTKAGWPQPKDRTRSLGLFSLRGHSGAHPVDTVVVASRLKVNAFLLFVVLAPGSSCSRPGKLMGFPLKA